MDNKHDNQLYTAASFGKPLRSYLYDLRKIWHPQWFQGNRRTQRYFEGWYFKNVSASRELVWSFIPGISLVQNDAHAFVQAINGETGQTYYFRYPVQEFLFAFDTFEVRIGENHFSETGIHLSLKSSSLNVSGSLSFDSVIRSKAGIRRPGIMGWYRYVPFMECYHGLVSMSHNIRGSLLIHDRESDFTGGKGYIEKDWGTSMPQAWVWMQSNHFTQTGASFMLSVAKIPWIGRAFTGFLGFLRTNENLWVFATYTGAKLTGIKFDKHHTYITIRDSKYTYTISGTSRNVGSLKAPVFGEMERTIHESIDAELHVTVKDLKGQILFDGTGVSAGLELVGNVKMLK